MQSGCPFLIGADTNAYHRTWHSNHNDARGDNIVDFCGPNDLYLFNQPGDLYTYESIHGKSNIDVTFGTRELIDSYEFKTTTVAEENQFRKIFRNKPLW